MSKSSIWLGTFNNPKVETKEFLQKFHEAAKAKYTCGQLEKGVSLTPHIQFYISFKDPVRLTKLTKLCPHGHFIPIKFDHGADRYCMKDDTRVEGPWEYGTKPVQRSCKEDW